MTMCDCEHQERCCDRAVEARVKRERPQAHALLEDLGRAVPAGEVDLVRPGALGLLVEVDEKSGSSA